jgi:hypothetical protein
MSPNRLLAALLATCLGLAAWSAEDAKHRTPAKHTKNGVTCHDCHQQENPSKAAVAVESCMACHGDYPAMADYTRKLALNPHAPPTGNKHPGPFACTECHHQHKPPVVKCLECHPSFKLTPR